MDVHIVRIGEELPRWIRERVIDGKMPCEYDEVPEGLQELQKGIYARGDINLVNVHSPIVIVHPFHKRNGHRPEYLRALEKIVKKYPGPLITFESYCSLQNTVTLYDRTGRTRESYFIKTFPNNPEPTHSTWDESLDFIKKFAGKPIITAGGYLGNTPSPTGVKKGCLRTVIKKLQKKDLQTEVIPELTFDWRE